MGKPVMPTVQPISQRVTPPVLPPAPPTARDRGRIAAVHLRRVFDAAPNQTGDGVELRVLGADGQPLIIELPLEAAMTLLNGLRRLATAERWFAVE